MANRFQNVNEWLAACRAAVMSDRDNVVLFTGPEGEGKSTLAFQVMSALDPAFDATRAHFGIAHFLAAAPATPRYGAVLADELEANKRRAMSGLTLDLLDFLKDCRGLNLHLGICFPHESLFEGAILNFRVRWKVHVPKRGLFIVSERVERKWRRKSGEEVTTFLWVERGRWPFAENRGRKWAAYRKKKDEHMLNLGGAYREMIETPTGVDREVARGLFSRVLEERGEWVDPAELEAEAPARPAKVVSSGVDVRAAAARFARLREEEERKAGAAGQIRARE